jgi:hypothetical protein
VLLSQLRYVPSQDISLLARGTFQSSDTRLGPHSRESARPGVSAVLFSAAGVLAAGYTTLGELADLKGIDDYRRQVRRERNWDELIDPWDKRVVRFEKRPRKPGQRRQPRNIGEVLKWGSALIVVAVFRLIKWQRVRHAENEGVRIDEMLRYLDRDTFFFSNGLAKDIPELYERLEETDRQILALRGEEALDSDHGANRNGDTPGSGATLSAEQGQKPGSRRILGMLCSLIRTGVTRRRKVEENNQINGLEESEWRQARLELAAGLLIAFANQKVMEQKFNRLKLAVRIGGLAVAVGVGAFVVAPKFSKEIALDITRPTQVSVQITGDNFGLGCPRGMLLQGVAVGGTWKEPIVVTKARGTCVAREVTLNSGQAIAVPLVSGSPTPSQSPLAATGR